MTLTMQTIHVEWYEVLKFDHSKPCTNSTNLYKKVYELRTYTNDSTDDDKVT